MRLAATTYFSSMPLKLKVRNVSNKHNTTKNPNLRESDQQPIYKRDRRVELGSTEKQLQLSGQGGTRNRDLQIWKLAS